MDNQALKAAIITSFSVLGKTEDDAALPNECSYIEAYAFMHQCLPDIEDDTSVVRYLAQNYRANNIGKIEQLLLDRFAGTQIVALATYMPEITGAIHTPEFLTDSIDALRLLIDVVRRLNTKTETRAAHPIKTIELVAGSRVEGVMKKKAASPRYFISRQHASNSLSGLIEALEQVAHYAWKPSPVFFAIELEPGPLFVVPDIHMIRDFCRMIDQSGSPALKRCVGLNLDVPHWHFLAGISPEWLTLPENRSILNRITHAHISDHHIGHFCDATINTFPKHAPQFQRWITVLKQLCSSSRSLDCPDFSGFISCEMEACKEVAFLQQSYTTLTNLLR